MENYIETDYPDDYNDDPWFLRLVGPIFLLGHEDKLHCYRATKASAGARVQRNKR